MSEFCYSKNGPCDTLPWPREFGIFLEVIAVILAVLPFPFLIDACYAGNTLMFVCRLTGLEKYAQAKKVAQAVVCPSIIYSIKLEEQTSSPKLYDAIDPLLQRLPRMTAARSKYPGFFKFLRVLFTILLCLSFIWTWLYNFFGGFFIAPEAGHYFLQMAPLCLIPLVCFALLVSNVRWRWKTRRYEAKIAEKTAHHTCTSEKGCFQQEQRERGEQSPKEKPEWLEVEV